MVYNFSTVGQEIFAGVYFCGLAIFGVLRELIFLIRTDWFFLLGINSCDFQTVPSTQYPALIIFSFLLSTSNRNMNQFFIEYCFVSG